MADFVVAIDQGTTSTRAIVFDRTGAPVATGQREHRQHYPRPGWVEHDATEIRDNVDAVVAEALDGAALRAADIAAVGITNQRETTILWDRQTGQPVAPAIVWQDTRTQDIVDRIANGDADRLRDRTGLPFATYFSASKIAWTLEHIDGVRARAEAGSLAFGTPDSWVLWNLTGEHATDVTNASRTLLMSLDTLDWHDDLLTEFGIPSTLLPRIRSSSELFGEIRHGALKGVPVAGILGDQQAAAFGQTAFEPGESKNTYGTGNFLIVNTGDHVVRSQHGLISTVAYQLGNDPARYALEGSVAVTGSLVQWLRDNLGIIASSSEVEALATSVDDNGGVYFVPAFAGLFAPRWRPDARGIIAGLTGFAHRAHIARAALESTAFQTADVVDAAISDLGVPLTELRVDGGMVANSTLMQFQADILDLPVVRPAVNETTALGAAYAAGLAVGFWSSLDELRSNWREAERWEPSMTPVERDRLRRQWRKALDRTLDWLPSDH